MATTNAMATTSVKIFRFKLSDEVMTLITQFSKIHQFDDRHTYKEAWSIWLTENQDTVEREMMRLEQLGYSGDITDKMFKAGRYYFREKVAIKNTGVSEVVENATTTTKQHRNYIVMNPEIIQAMDHHLKDKMKTNGFKPELAYIQFCEQHVELVRKEIARLLQENKSINISGDQMSAKFKKTYKNRYFILSN